MTLSFIPEGFHTVTPYLAVRGAAGLVDFLVAAFDAEVRDRVALPDGTVRHAEVKIGDSMVMIGDVGDEREPNRCCLYVYVPDTDATYRRAMEAGATSILAPQDQFYGDRNGGVTDPCGNQWWIGTRVEVVSKEELERRMAAAAAEERRNAE